MITEVLLVLNSYYDIKEKSVPLWLTIITIFSALIEYYKDFNPFSLLFILLDDLALYDRILLLILFGHYPFVIFSPLVGYLILRLTKKKEIAFIPLILLAIIFNYVVLSI